METGGQDPPLFERGAGRSDANPRPQPAIRAAGSRRNRQAGSLTHIAQGRENRTPGRFPIWKERAALKPPPKQAIVWRLSPRVASHQQKSETTISQASSHRG